MDRKQVKKVTHYCDPESLGDVGFEVFREAFRKLAAAEYPNAEIEITTDPNEDQIDSGTDDWDPIDEFEFLDQLAEKAFDACL